MKELLIDFIEAATNVQGGNINEVINIIESDKESNYTVSFPTNTLIEVLEEYEKNKKRKKHIKEQEHRSIS
ncbi:hypothetical protein THIOSC15_490006 [uncultured Thiomicrorhabdus sp.]